MGLFSRDGTSQIFTSTSRDRAWCIEPGQTCQNITPACLEIKMLKFELKPALGLFEN